MSTETKTKCPACGAEAQPVHAGDEEKIQEMGKKKYRCPVCSYEFWIESPKL